VKTLAAHINGGGGGQPFYATAGGTDLAGINAAISEANSWINTI
jgi:alanyl-tRNA synthetase